MKVKEKDYLMPLEVSGYKFRNNFVVGSGPAVKTLDMIKQIEQWGWGGASLKLSIDPTYISKPPRYRWLKKHRYHAFTAETRLSLDQGLKLMEEARKNVSELILYANMAYAGDEGDEGWVRMAKKYEAAGAHVIELNMCCPNMSFNVQSSGGKTAIVSGASVGSNAQIVSRCASAVKKAVGIPVFVKLTPEGGKIGQVARACFDAGIDSVGGTGNRLAIPDFDIYNPERGICRLQDEPTLACFSGPWLKPLALRDVYEMRKNSLPQHVVMGSGGIETGKDAVQMMMCGADFIQICTAVMLKGFGVLPKIVNQVKRFMDEKGYRNYRDFRDAVVSHISPTDSLTLYRGNAVIDDEKCTGCGLCVNIGHCYAISLKDDKAVVNPQDCTGCSTCIDICPAGAVSMEQFEKMI
ncbi:MAG: 4Fe-4S binding protein [Deltaproteobacteria bacterium]|nr:4Fe-4S binding protein [Deltaproteobacteria bacterium]MBW2151082.1 4Fe-4S binding protein [Deltaproteobacteria bacterium]